MNETKDEIPNISNLATATAVPAVENKMPNVSNLVKKLTITQKLVKLKKNSTDHDHDKYITTQEVKKLTSENFTARLKQANLASTNDIPNFVKKDRF